MKRCDTDKLHKMVDEFCIDKRPKSLDIHKMIQKCTEYNSILVPKEYKPNYNNDSEVANAIKLNMAVEIFEALLGELKNISIKQFIEHYMSVYGLTENDILG